MESQIGGCGWRCPKYNKSTWQDLEWVKEDPPNVQPTKHEKLCWGWDFYNKLINARIPIHDYLYVLPQPSNLLQSLKYANVIIIDKMLMMTNTMLCAVQQWLKEVQDNMNPFANVLLLLVKDLAQLLAICKHYLKKNELHINFVTFQWLHVGQMQVITFH